MKDKIKAILRRDTDEDIKVDLLDDLFKASVPEISERKKMAMCFDFLYFMADRNQLILDLQGLEGVGDDFALPPTEIWERFVIYRAEKYKKP